VFLYNATYHKSHSVSNKINDEVSTEALQSKLRPIVRLLFINVHIEFHALCLYRILISSELMTFNDLEQMYKSEATESAVHLLWLLLIQISVSSRSLASRSRFTSFRFQSRSAAIEE